MSVMNRSARSRRRPTADERPLRDAALAVLAGLMAVIGAAMILVLSVQPAGAQSRIKDIVDVQGVRDNMLIGYGLVVGLDGSGDSLNGSPFTEQSLTGMLERLGVNIRGDQLDTDNIAAVMVSATLPPSTGQGTRIDVSGGLAGAISLQPPGWHAPGHAVLGADGGV